MATARTTVDAILDAAQGATTVAGALSCRKMFGEYALYLGGKVVAFVCDDRLFVKDTGPGRAFLGPDAAEGFPYPGARPHLLGDALLDEPDRLAALLRMTAAALPPPAPKRRRG